MKNFLWTRVLTLRGDELAGYQALIPLPPAYTPDGEAYIDAARELMTFGGIAMSSLNASPITWHCYVRS